MTTATGEVFFLLHLYFLISFPEFGESDEGGKQGRQGEAKTGSASDEDDHGNGQNHRPSSKRPHQTCSGPQEEGGGGRDCSLQGGDCGCSVVAR